MATYEIKMRPAHLILTVLIKQSLIEIIVKKQHTK